MVSKSEYPKFQCRFKLTGGSEGVYAGIEEFCNLANNLIIVSLFAMFLRKVHSLYFWLLLSVVNICGILPWFNIQYLIVDLGESMYHVRELGIGRVPYRDIVSHHFLGYLLPLYLIDQVVSLTPFALKILTLLVNFFNAIVLARSVTLIATPKCGRLAALLTVTVGWFWGWQGMTFNNQSYLLPIYNLLLYFLIVAIQHKKRRALFLAACFFGLGLTFDQRFAPYAVLFLVPLLSIDHFRTLTSALIIFLAFILFPGACLLYLNSSGALPDFWQHAILFPLFYRNVGVEGSTFKAFLALISFATRVEILSMALLGVSLIVQFRLENRVWLRLLTLMMTLLNLTYIFLGGRLYPNYFYIFAPLVLLQIALLPWYAEQISRRLGVLTMKVTIAICVVMFFRPFIPLLKGRSIFIPGSEETLVKAVEVIRDLHPSRESVLVWGYKPQLYVLTNTFSPFRDMGLLSVAGSNYGVREMEAQGIISEMYDEFVESFLASPPDVFVYYRVNRSDCETCFGIGPTQFNFDFRKVAHLHFIQEVISDCYSLVTVIENIYDRAEIYRRDQHVCAKKN